MRAIKGKGHEGELFNGMFVAHLPKGEKRQHGKEKKESIHQSWRVVQSNQLNNWELSEFLQLSLLLKNEN